MKVISNTQKGIFFALCAAALNGTIGVFSKFLIYKSLSPSWIALLKTILGASIILIFFMAINKLELKKNIFGTNFILPAFFGIFCLFFFETHAYETMSAANVTVILMSCSTFSAILFTKLILKDSLGSRQLIGFFFAAIGISIILGLNENITFIGSINALLAGCGYGLFTVLLKSNNIEGGMLTTFKLLFWGGVFLSIPAYGTPFPINDFFTKEIIFAIMGLAIFPSILGFFCTTKSVTYISPAKVQIIELTEPVFASIFAFIVLGEGITLVTLIGAIITLFGVYIGAIKSS
ncbi:DMT family transporter [Thiothrix subterranea]|uniref:DMT family transporter n=1 Tax=Thiothrix subterranea TaxID=2735563 RepID=UPI00192ABBCD|nr:DMT family transporter [Thiothrix subterranea]QQZ28758.1 DMT family transporter [Thiothrix subterranea]